MTAVTVSNFYNKHKLKLIMFAPLIFGIAFFTYSSISALRTIDSVNVPDDFQNINVQVKEYNVSEIDHETNQLKWTLKATSAITNNNHTKAKIKDAHMEMFENKKLAFTLESDYAQINEAEQEVNLYENVKVIQADGAYVINSGALKYKDSDDNFYVTSSWSLESKKGITIKGIEGKIKKDFNHVVSKGNASVTSDDFQLNAYKITLGQDEPTIAQGNAVLNLKSKSSSLRASTIKINPDGSIDANGSIKVKTDKIECFSENLEIAADKQKNPSLATFTGNPYIIQNNKKIFADLVTYDFNTGKASVEGNVHTGT